MFREGKVPLFFTAMRYMDDDIWRQEIQNIQKYRLESLKKKIDWTLANILL